MKKEEIEKLPKEKLVEIVERLSNDNNGIIGEIVNRAIENYFRDKEKERLSYYEKKSYDAKCELDDFMKEMQNKYQTETCDIKDLVKVMNLDEKWKYYLLVSKHTECLDKENEELDKQYERLNKKYKRG